MISGSLSERGKVTEKVGKWRKIFCSRGKQGAAVIRLRASGLLGRC